MRREPLDGTTTGAPHQATQRGAEAAADKKHNAPHLTCWRKITTIDGPSDSCDLTINPRITA
jgi:hypothetical protein